MLLLEQLVPIWDWEDAAGEVKQLAPVWSSKHRHTLLRDMKGESKAELCRTRVHMRRSTCRDGREIENEVGRESEANRPINYG